MEAHSSQKQHAPKKNTERERERDIREREIEKIKLLGAWLRVRFVYSCHTAGEK